ncbi:MAG: hypothetical protein V2A54_15195 [Bacteroidota bacterium]
MTKRIRKYKLLLGSLLLGMFISDCGNETTEKKSRHTCYDTIPNADSIARAEQHKDSLRIADSIKKSDSIRISDSVMKAKKKKNTKPKPKPVQQKTCYMPIHSEDAK